VQVLVVLLFIAVVALIAWYAWYAKKKRREEFAFVARQMGLVYAPDDPFGLVDLPFALFGKGDGRGCENVLSGRWKDLELKACDYWYYDESTDSEGHRTRSYHRFSCAIATFGAACPHLALSRESLFSRMADRLGFRDIEFESEEFNRAFQVTSKDRKFAFDLVDARMMKWLLAGEGWSFEVVGPFVLCFTGRLKPSALVPLLGTLREFRERIPRIVPELYPAA
jgi:hypothetical protein